MNMFFTSDTHFGHERIVELCNRPFKDADHMNTEIVRRWNDMVSPDDVVYHLGDVALGKIDDSLAIVSRLNGYKILVNGNHDRPFMKFGKDAFGEWLARYEDVFQEVVVGNLQMSLGEHQVMLSHFPHSGDSHGAERYKEWRPADEGIIVHGHTHKNQRVSTTPNDNLQIHVGQDAWDYRPVSSDNVLTIIENWKTLGGKG